MGPSDAADSHACRRTPCLSPDYKKDTMNAFVQLVKISIHSLHPFLPSSSRYMPSHSLNSLSQSTAQSLSCGPLIIRVIHWIMSGSSPSLIKQILKVGTRRPSSRPLRQIQRARAQMHAVLLPRAQRRSYTWTIRRRSAQTLRACVPLRLRPQIRQRDCLASSESAMPDPFPGAEAPAA
jgi:hypothetical protein